MYMCESDGFWRYGSEASKCSKATLDVKAIKKCTTFYKYVTLQIQECAAGFVKPLTMVSKSWQTIRNSSDVYGCLNDLGSTKPSLVFFAGGPWIFFGRGREGG